MSKSVQIMIRPATEQDVDQLTAFSAAMANETSTVYWIELACERERLP
ncbi:MAG: hypothetical protein U0361_11700 [Nitrospiraceae bacterium]